jgi:hypothetical protein
MHQVHMSQTSENGDAVCVLRCQGNRFYFWWKGKLWSRAKSKSTKMVVQQGSMRQMLEGKEIKTVLYQFKTERLIVWPAEWDHEQMSKCN